MPQQPEDQGLAARARRLDAEARHHKREERRHRKAAQAARRQLAQLETACTRLGIDLSIASTPTSNNGEGPSPWPAHPSSISTR